MRAKREQIPTDNPPAESDAMQEQANPLESEQALLDETGEIGEPSEALQQNEPEPKTVRLARVAERASVCVACDLAATRSHVVFGEGNPEAPLILIGEGPGQNEDATGRPFVGRSGVLLDQCLRENGMTRKHIYLCNVVRCRACALEAGRLKNRPPTTEEARACATWLEQTIGIVQPLVILCLGGPSANAIIKKGFKIMTERGQWFESKYAPYSMAALHPAYILRQEGEAYEAGRRSLVEDIGAARLKVIEARREPKLTLF